MSVFTKAVAAMPLAARAPPPNLKPNQPNHSSLLPEITKPGCGAAPSRLGLAYACPPRVPCHGAAIPALQVGHYPSGEVDKTPLGQEASTSLSGRTRYIDQKALG